MRLYVGNLEKDVTEQELSDLFASAGTVVSAVVVLHRDTGRPRGFGFVEMASDAEGERAMQRFNGHALKGRPLVVNEAKADPAKR
ncbi:MAG TPA: RNA-binding protein [bacterium]|nr:RNA-binding protein [bacterium]